MSVTISGIYIGNKKVKSRHDDSGSEIITIAPKDNHGDGSLFSPTDLCVTSMATCMLTIMAMAAEADGVSLLNATYRAQKFMHASPRRISKIIIDFTLNKSLDAAMRTKLENAAHNCPVKRSMHADVLVEVSFSYS